MKIIALRKKIITNLSVSGALLGIVGLIFFYDFHKKEAMRLEAEEVQMEVSNIRSQAAELQNKIAESTKYQEVWKNISANKKFVGNLKFDDVNAKINTLAEKYLLSQPVIKMTIPEPLNQGILNRSTVNIAVSSVNLTFEAIDDLRVLSFVADLMNSVHGYIVISNFEIKKTKKYSDQDLVEISTGKNSGAIQTTIDFYWYFFKPKDDEKSKIIQPIQSNQGE